MGESIKNERYRKLYMDLYFLMIRAYKDCGILDSLKQYISVNETRGDYFNEFSDVALGHICELVKADLALCLYKLTENNRKANSVFSLNWILRNEYHIDICPRLSKETKKTIEKVTQIRNTTIAHNDIGIVDSMMGLSINVDAMRDALEDLRMYLNVLYQPDIDERVRCFSDSTESIYRAKVGFGMHGLLLGSMEGV